MQVFIDGNGGWMTVRIHIHTADLDGLRTANTEAGYTEDIDYRFVEEV
jgi:hypothetical protein